MSTEGNKDVVRRLFEGLDRGDVDVVDEVCAADYQLHFAGVPGPLPRDATKQFFGAFLSAFPDIKHAIQDIIAEGERVSARLAISGTQRGAFQGMPPTGKRISISATNIFHLANGKLAEHWVDYDALGMMQQLGVIPAPAQPAA